MARSAHPCCSPEALAEIEAETALKHAARVYKMALYDSIRMSTDHTGSIAPLTSGATAVWRSARTRATVSVCALTASTTGETSRQRLQDGELKKIKAGRRTDSASASSAVLLAECCGWRRPPASRSVSSPPSIGYFSGTIPIIYVFLKELRCVGPVTSGSGLDDVTSPPGHRLSMRD